MQDAATSILGRQAAPAGLLVALFILGGCSRSPYELAPVHGVVTIDGQPLSRAKVMFAPVEVSGSVNPGKPAFGLISEDGSYRLTTYKSDDGAVVGEHWVTIINLGKRESTGRLVSNTRSAGRSFSRLTVPQKVIVAAGEENQIDLKLTGQDVAKYGLVIGD